MKCGSNCPFSGCGKRAETKLEKFFGFFLHKAKLCATFASPNRRNRPSDVRSAFSRGSRRRGGHVERVVPWDIELWCNGNTTDSGPVFPGSSPGSSTRKPVKHSLDRLFVFRRPEACTRRRPLRSLRPAFLTKNLFLLFLSKKEPKKTARRRWSGSRRTPR